MGKFTSSPIRKSSGNPVKAPSGADTALYERDCYAWSIEQAKALRERRFADLDIENLAEEIEDVGKSEYRALVSALSNLLMHLLKWDIQPTHRSRSWELSVRKQRQQVADVLEDNPSLKSRLSGATERAFRLARTDAVRETALAEEKFPEVNPYDWTAIMERSIEFDREHELGQVHDR